MRHLLSTIWLIFLQSVSLMCSAVAGCWNAAASFFHIAFVTAATRHDIKYALRPDEQAKSRFMMQQSANANSGSSKTFDPKTVN